MSTRHVATAARTTVLALATLAATAVATPAFADTGAPGAAANSPGFLSGNVIQVPVHVPVTVCGETVDVIGLLNPSSGATCVNS